MAIAQTKIMKWALGWGVCGTLSFAALAEVAIETVVVGNPGNEAEWSGESHGGQGQNRRCGAVEYAYEIGKFEVTAGQYTDFLNAVAASDPHDLWSPWMWNAQGLSCQIERVGVAGSYGYRIAEDWADRPVTMVSWGDAARFCNWMHNGQPVGVQDMTTTERGSYRLDGAVTYLDLNRVRRRPNATWVIPTEDEWYKAAYHANDGSTGTYFSYPTASDTKPSNDLIQPDPGNNATYGIWIDNYNQDYTIGDPYYRAVSGSHQNSASPYGTFDQAGNVGEWTEGKYGRGRKLRGASFYHAFGNGDGDLMHAAFSNDLWETSESYGHGFRLALITPSCRGDGNGDQSVDLADLAMLLGQFGVTGDGVFDLNQDGVVDLQDLEILLAEFGRTCR